VGAEHALPIRLVLEMVGAVKQSSLLGCGDYRSRWGRVVDAGRALGIQSKHLPIHHVVAIFRADD
jgi:hypothetical protein